MGFDAVVFDGRLIKVQLLTVDGDVHAAVVVGRHWAGR